MPHLFVPISYYGPECRASVLLLRNPPDPDLQERIRAFQRIIVWSPRIDQVPRSVPETHKLLQDPEFVHQTGWIYVFARTSSL